jgi:hypothetical protein
MESSAYQRARQEWDERYADLVLANATKIAGWLIRPIDTVLGPRW